MSCQRRPLPGWMILIYFSSIFSHLLLTVTAAAGGMSRQLGSTLYQTEDIFASVEDLSMVADQTISSRRLLQTDSTAIPAQPFPSSGYPTSNATFPGSIDHWTSCFPGDNAVRRISLGIAVDVGFYNLFNSRQEVLNYISLQISIINRIYLTQVSLQFIVGEILIMDEPGTYAWNHSPNPSGSPTSSTGLCGSTVTISSVLDDFTAWRRDYRPNSQAVWHLFTNCFPPPGLVGLSWIGGVCQNDIGTGVDSFSSTFWLTLAHELGHSLGAPHSFQLGEGQTGGIMDYADGSWPLGSGQYQFNTLYSKQSICNQLTAIINSLSSSTSSSFTPYCIDTSNPYLSQCGNGIVEIGEQCDDDSSCCDLRTCLLGVGKQCSPGSSADQGQDGECCQNCLFVPSTTKCNVQTDANSMTNSLGYCSNGICRPSNCDDFYGELQFCGLKASNPCRETCRVLGTSGGVGQCTDGFTVPNMNLPIGTLCQSYPHSTCQMNHTSNQIACMETSTSATASFSWVSGPWSTCLGDCGIGVINRTVSCIDALTGLAVDETQCSGSKPSSSTSCTLATCPSYAWSSPVWSPCDTDCGTGQQQNRPRCLNYGAVIPVVVPSSDCANLPAPVSSQSCVGALGPTCPVAWKYTEYSPCTKTCGGGLAYSTRTCVQTRNSFTYILDDSACQAVTATQPLSVACNTAACPSYYWQYGLWSTCSASCNGGTQQRSATCMDSVTGTVSTDATKCSDSTLNPLGQELLQRSCNTAPCPVYGWIEGNWSNCSVACGGGESYALIQCFDSSQATAAQPNGVAVADQNCVTTRPLGVQSCNTGACPDYHYRTGVWSSCSQNCSGGVMTRVVSCHNMQGIRMADCTLNNCPDVDDSFCQAKGLTRPPSQSTCNQQSCIGAMWWAQDWGDCSAPCDGRGNQTRRVDCVSTGTWSLLPEASCGGSKPEDVQVCNTQQCSEYQFVPGSWSNCSNVCGGGTRTRGVTCIFGGVEVDSSQCTAHGELMPETTGVCNTQACATFWWTSDFGPCSKDCEYGSATRQVECRSSVTIQGVLVDDSECSSTKPASTAVCNVFPCPQWVTGDWSICSARCGDGGNRTRSVICLSYDNNIVANAQCVHDMPVPTEPCVLSATTTGIATSATGETATLHQPCPHWHRSEWGDCSRPCGSGYQNRTLLCRMPHDTVYMGRIADDPTLCPSGYQGSDAGPLISTGSDLNSPGSYEDNSVPSLTQVCNTNPCPDYYWIVQWGTCSAACAGGTQPSSKQCIRNRDNSVVADNLCLDLPPAATRPCNSQPCPTYEWFNLTDWGPCSVQCGSGVAVRDIRCRNRTPDPMLNIPYEIVKDENCPADTKPDNQRPCIFPKDQCYGLVTSSSPSTVATTPKKNGKCVAGQCLCRAGFGPGGSDCNTPPAISNVLLNSLQFNQQGIPFGELIQITWTSSTFIDYVSILLVNDHLVTDDSGVVIPFPQLIQSRQLNNGSIVWAVGSNLQFGIGSGGSDFRLRVRFDDTIYADTATTLTLANPCGYVSCGQQGRCVSGGRCVCNTGWSGSQCQLGPCDRLKCNTAHGTCIIINPSNSTSIAPVASCQCRDGWSGSHCATPPGCTSTCVNGGDYVVSAIITTASDTTGSTVCPTQCSCPSFWSSANNCASCALVCQNGGNFNGDCSSCICGEHSGYFGLQCQCNYYVLKMKFKFDPSVFPGLADVNSWITSQEVIDLFSDTLTRDFAQSIGMDSNFLTVGVDHINSTGLASGEVLMDVHFSKLCRERSSFDAYGGYSKLTNTKHTRVAPHLINKRPAAFRELAAITTQTQRRRLLQTTQTNSSMAVNTNDNLFTIYNVLCTQFGDLSSSMYRGLLTSCLDPSYQMVVFDPTGRDSLTNPPLPVDSFQTSDDTSTVDESGGDGFFNRTMILVIVVSLTILFIGIATLFILRYHLNRRRVSETKHIHEPIPSHSRPGSTQTTPVAKGRQLDQAASNAEASRMEDTMGGVPIGDGTLDDIQLHMPQFHIPMYDQPASSSGRHTPAVELSAPSTAASSAQVSRRGSETEMTLESTLLQRKRNVPPIASNLTIALQNLGRGSPKAAAAKADVQTTTVQSSPTICASPSVVDETSSNPNQSGVHNSDVV